MGQESEDDMQLATLAIAMVAERAEGVVYACQIGTGDIVEKQGRGSCAAGQIVAPEGLLDLVLTGAELVERFVEVVFIELGQPEHLGDGVIAGPTDGREA